MNPAAQTSRTVGNFSTSISTWGLECINPEAYKAITFFGHRAVKSVIFGINTLKVLTRCSSPSQNTFSLVTCEGELLFKITKDSLNLITAELSHTITCKYAHNKGLSGTLKINSIKSPNIPDFQKKCIDELISTQKFLVNLVCERESKRYLDLYTEDSKVYPVPPAMYEQEYKNIDRLSCAIKTFLHIFESDN